MKLNILRKISNLNFAILLLLVIAFFSVLGTIVEQDQNINYYKTTYSTVYIYSNITLYQIIIFLGIDHVYKTWWFFFLLFIFGTSLVSCTFTQQFPLVKFAKRLIFKCEVTKYINEEYFGFISSEYFLDSLNNLKRKKYNILQQQNYLYFYKGILGRFAPIIVHISMIMILCGNFIGSLGILNSQELLTKGEIFYTQNIISKNILTKISDFPIRTNDFWIEYNKTNSIEQFYSDLSILNSYGEEIIQKTITVNFPFQFKNITIYQTDWNTISLRIKLDNNVYQLPLKTPTNSKNLFLTYLPVKKGIIFVSNNLKGTFSLYDKNGKLLGFFNMGNKINNLENLVIFELINETGLQIRQDPGIFLIYSGFAILMLSSIISYFSHTQFWYLKLKKQLLISASSNRAKLNLKIIFLNLIYKKSKK